jgi:hypothetical protein
MARDLCWAHRVLAGGEQWHLVDGERCEQGPHDDHTVRLDLGEETD